MKKLTFILSLAVLAVSIALIIFIVKSNKFSKSNNPTKAFSKPVVPSNGITLDGKSSTDAEQMVLNFADDNTSSEKKTSIWLSKPWVDNVYNLLLKEPGTDGFRVYFAKNSNGINTIIITSTQNGHVDNFTHTNPQYQAFLSDLQRNPQNYITEDHGGNDVKGARFYDDTYNCSGAPACVYTEGNNVDCEVAHTAVKKFRDQPKAYPGINTENEWYPFSLLQGLHDELATTPTSTVIPDGVRIYFAKDETTHRHFFIFVPTQKNGTYGNNIPSHLDNFDCFAISSFMGPTDNGEECPNNCDGSSMP